MNNFLKNKIKFLIVLLGVLFSSCLSHVENAAVVDPCATITFTLNVKPIIDNSCVQCHGNNGSYPNLTSYSNISTNASIVKDAVVNLRMPKGGALTTTEISAISCWVDAGALNN